MNFFIAVLATLVLAFGILIFVLARLARRTKQAPLPPARAPGAVAPGMPRRSEPFRDTACPVCSAAARYLADLDFNKTCMDSAGAIFPRAEIPIEYQQCSECGFIFAPNFLQWSKKDFETWIYNHDYPLTDPEYLLVRPSSSVDLMQTIFGDKKDLVRHLDYGGGNGEMSRLLRQDGWNSVSYDPLADADFDTSSLGRFDIITAIEVIEHVPDPQEFMKMVMQFLADDGVIIVSTLLSDARIAPGGLDWWYASPRNGHISLYSLKSLGTLAHQHGFELRFFEGITVLNRKPPSWALEMFPS